MRAILAHLRTKTEDPLFVARAMGPVLVIFLVLLMAKACHG